ncbi:PREDICTED: uncharacterized protein LOC104602542 [Nelumbo nucifera]|uniref:Uncharacterized protein LOC104602542 n=1 Tax=Nelumbo nucifera TaxID=4432 RepID=A0A1U8ACI4_NELNU|nr:PREDICTED: uncharacterized protein LOC104602542 [Nelumbo nucifera]
MQFTFMLKVMEKKKSLSWFGVFPVYYDGVVRIDPNDAYCNDLEYDAAARQHLPGGPARVNYPVFEYCNTHQAPVGREAIDLRKLTRHGGFIVLMMTGAWKRSSRWMDPPAQGTKKKRSTMPPLPILITYGGL